jgi:hypothetical protein
MRRYSLLLIASLTVLGCDDDDGPQDLPPEDASAAKDASRDDAAASVLDAAKLDATVVVDAEVVPAEDAAASPVDATTFDSAVHDAGLDAGGEDASMCVAAAERCAPGACCEGHVCVTSSEAPFDICAKTCSQDSECDSGCCASLAGSGADKVCAPQLYCRDDSALLPLQVACSNPELIAGDGTYLGKATARFDSESVCNKSGEYGSFFGTNSIFNASGKYGGFGQYSAYSTSAFYPPAIKCGSSSFAEAYVSKSTYQQNERVIDPDDLCTVLKLSNL